MANWENIWDVWTDILCLLPLKTLLVMRSVNKFFLVLINSEGFVASFHRSRRLHGGSDMVVFLHTDYGKPVQKSGYRLAAPSYCRIAQRDSLDRINYYATNLKLSFSRLPVVVGSLDGLVLIRTRGRRRSRCDVATLWNPSLRKFRHLRPPSSYTFSSLKLGLGYDALTMDYKVLAMVNLMNPPVGVWVYSVLKTRSWTPLLNSGLSIMCAPNFIPAFWVMCDPVPFKGSLFWVETAWNSVAYMQRLSRFDLATNQFRYSTMPDYQTPSGWFFFYQSLTIMDTCLAVDKCDWGTGLSKWISMWIMDDVDAMTWTKISVSSQDQAFKLHSKYWTKGCSFSTQHTKRKVETLGVYAESLLLLLN